MRSYIGKFLNREHEVYVLDIIGDYCSSFRDWRNYAYRYVNPTNFYQFYRLRFYVTKRKHLGKIYVETICSPGLGGKKYVSSRKYLLANMWRRMGNFSIEAAVCPLKKVLRELEKTMVDTTNLQNMISICTNYAANYAMIVPR
jgi:hypothetical protein